MPIFRYVPSPFNGSLKFTSDVADEAAAIVEIGPGNYDEEMGLTTTEPDLYANQFVNTKTVSRGGDYYFGIDKLAPAVAAGMIKTSHAAVIISEQIEPPYNILVKQKGTGEAFISGVLIGETVPDGGDCTIAASGTFTSEDIGLVITDQEVGAYVYINDEGDLTWNNDSARAVGWLLANDIFFVDVGIYNGMCSSPSDGFITAKGLHLDQSSDDGHGVEFINSSGNVVGRIHSDNDSGTNKLKISASSNEADGCQVVFTNRDGNNLMDINPDDNFVGMNHNRLTDVKTAEYPDDATNYQHIQQLIRDQSGYHVVSTGGGTTVKIYYSDNGKILNRSNSIIEVHALSGTSTVNKVVYFKYYNSGSTVASITWFNRSDAILNKSDLPYELHPGDTMTVFGDHYRDGYHVTQDSYRYGLYSVNGVYDAGDRKLSNVSGITLSSEGNGGNYADLKFQGSNTYFRIFEGDAGIIANVGHQSYSSFSIFSSATIIYDFSVDGLDMFGKPITNVADGLAPGHVVSYEQLAKFGSEHRPKNVELGDGLDGVFEVSTSTYRISSKKIDGIDLSSFSKSIIEEVPFRFDNKSEFQTPINLPENVFIYVDHIMRLDGTKIRNVEFDQEYSDGALRVILEENCSGIAIIKVIKYESN